MGRGKFSPKKERLIKWKREVTNGEKLRIIAYLCVYKSKKHYRIQETLQPKVYTQE